MYFDNMEFLYNVNNMSLEEIRQVTVIVHNITKPEVQAKDYSTVSLLFDKFHQLKTEARGKLILQFAGYDDTPEEIYEIKEIRDYVMGMFQRWPEMFYFLTQKDIIYKVILACISDVSIFIKGAEKKGLDKAIFEKEQLTPVHFTLSIPDNIKETIQVKLQEYGQKIGESEEVINEIIENLLDPRRGVKSNYEEFQSLANMNLLEVYENISTKYWHALIKDSKSFKIIQEHKLIDFIEKSRHIINMATVTQRLSTVILTQEKLTNVFVIRDEAYGHICPTCHSKTVVVFKKNLFSSIKNCIFLPSFENYIARKIIPLSDKFMTEAPIPVSPMTDKWVCPNCLKINSFKYDKETGLQY